MAQYAAYLLVHPERYPSNDPDVIAGELSDYVMDRTGGFDAAYGAQVAAAAGSADRRVALLDGLSWGWLVEEAEGALDIELSAGADADTLQRAAERAGEGAQLTVGVAAAGWELVGAEPFNVAERAVHALVDLPAGARVLVGGFARRDCVARAADALRHAGYRADICPMTALPLPATSVDRYLTRKEIHMTRSVEQTPAVAVDPHAAGDTDPHTTVVVLADGDTFTDLNGCRVVELPDDYLDRHDDYEDDTEVVCDLAAEAPFVIGLRAARPGHHLAMVLNDTDTVGPLDGCRVVRVPAGYDGDAPLADGVVVAVLQAPSA